MIVSLISFFGGFFSSSILDTSLGEFSEWAIVGTSLVVATIESFNAFYYNIKQRKKFIINSYLIEVFKNLNNFKIGIVYGLIVDAFKLGS
jgi:hypothetical protein